MSSCSLFSAKWWREHWVKSCQQHACVPVWSTYCSMLSHPQGGDIFTLQYFALKMQLCSLQVRVWPAFLQMWQESVSYSWAGITAIYHALYLYFYFWRNLYQLSSNALSNEMFVETNQCSKRFCSIFSSLPIIQWDTGTVRVNRWKWFRKTGGCGVPAHTHNQWREQHVFCHIHLVVLILVLCTNICTV